MPSDHIRLGIVLDKGTYVAVATALTENMARQDMPLTGKARVVEAVSD